MIHFLMPYEESGFLAVTPLPFNQIISSVLFDAAATFDNT
jgi:hypothetical protein